MIGVWRRFENVDEVNCPRFLFSVNLNNDINLKLCDYEISIVFYYLYDLSFN